MILNFQQQLQQQLRRQQLQLPELCQDVEVLTGPTINGVTMKTTMLIATGMEELVVSMTLADGTTIAM